MSDFHVSGTTDSRNVLVKSLMLSEIVTLVKGMPVLTNTKRSGLNVRENPDREYVAAIKQQ